MVIKRFEAFGRRSSLRCRGNLLTLQIGIARLINKRPQRLRAAVSCKSIVRHSSPEMECSKSQKPFGAFKFRRAKAKQRPRNVCKGITQHGICSRVRISKTNSMKGRGDGKELALSLRTLRVLSYSLRLFYFVFYSCFCVISFIISHRIMA